MESDEALSRNSGPSKFKPEGQTGQGLEQTNRLPGSFATLTPFPFFSSQEDIEEEEELVQRQLFNSSGPTALES